MKKYILYLLCIVSISYCMLSCNREERCTEIVCWINNTSYDMDVHIFTNHDLWQFDLLRGDTTQIYEGYYWTGGKVYPTILPTHYSPIDCQQLASNNGIIDSVKIFNKDNNELIFEHIVNSSSHDILCSDYLYTIIHKKQISLFEFVFTDYILAASLREYP